MYSLIHAFRREPALISIFILTVSGSMDALISPTLPRMAEELQIPLQLIGLLVSMYALPGIFLTLPAGLLVDKVGRKKPAILALLFFSIPGVLIAFTTDFMLILILRVIQGIGRIFLLFISLTLIGDIFKGPERLQVMGTNMAVLYIGSVTFSVLGGVLADISWKYPFLFHAWILFTIPFILKIKESRSVKNGEQLDIKSLLKSARELRILASLISGLALSYVYTGAIVTSLPMFLSQKFEATSSFIGVLLATLQLVSAIAAICTKAITKRLSSNSLLSGSFAAYGALLVPISYASDPILFIPLSASIGIFHGILVTIAPDIVTSSSPQHMRGSVVSLYSTMVRIGQMLGAAMLAHLLYLFGGYIFAYAGLLCLLVAILLSILLRIGRG